MEAENSGQLEPAGTRGFLPVWLAWITVGETLGFLAPVLTHLIASLFVPDFIFPLLVGAGAVEGALLGWAQAHVLRPRVRDLSRRRWMILSSLGAAAAWVIGMLPSAAAAAWERWPAPVQVLAGALAGLALLGSVGAAQSIELRRHFRGSLPWILGNGAAWGVGLLIFLTISTPLWQPGQPPAVIALIGVVAGIGMAVGMAAISGLVMERLIDRRLRGAAEADPPSVARNPLTWR